MLERFINAFSPLWYVFARVTGLKILQDSTIEALNLDDELTRRGLNGGEGSRAILDSYRANLARVLGGEATMPPPIAITGKEAAPSLESPAPFALGAQTAPEFPVAPPPERKKRGRPSKSAPASEIPPAAVSQASEHHPSTTNGVL